MGIKKWGNDFPDAEKEAKCIMEIKKWGNEGNDFPDAEDQ